MNLEQDLLDARCWRLVAAGSPPEFVRQVRALAQESEGARDLLELWDEEIDLAERDATVAALHELVEDQQPLPLEQTAPDVALLLEERLAWKEHLRGLVESHGGVSAVAEAAGIPQPSLSRMLNTPSEPRPSTLQRLAAGLGMPLEALSPAALTEHPVLVPEPTARYLFADNLGPGEPGQSQIQYADPSSSSRGHRTRLTRCERASSSATRKRRPLDRLREKSPR